MNVGKASKAAWLRSRLRCLRCGSTSLEPGAAAWTCPSCGCQAPVIGQAVSFLSEEFTAGLEIVDTDRVSDHAYNPTALKLLEQCASAGGMALDCGSGSRSFTSDSLVQVEIKPYPNVDVLAVNQALPFQDASFDIVFSFDVLEHVNDPFISARELSRVLKPGGYLYIDMPFLQVEHGYPHHYFNATRRGLLQLFKGELDVAAHIVPGSGHPAHVVWMALNTYRRGLPAALRARFEKLTVEELIDGGWKGLRDSDLGRSLDQETRWLMASATQALLSKPRGETNSLIDVDVAALPSFRPR